MNSRESAQNIVKLMLIFCVLMVVVLVSARIVFDTSKPEIVRWLKPNLGVISVVFFAILSRNR